jgi:hypothetical protein
VTGRELPDGDVAARARAWLAGLGHRRVDFGHAQLGFRPAWTAMEFLRLP